jgi:hypothetical protein
LIEILLAKDAERHRTSGNNFPKGCSQILAERLNLTTRTINLYIEVSNLIAPEVKELIALTPIADKLSELRILKKVPREEQRQLVEMFLGGEARSVEQAWRKLHRKNQVELSSIELRQLAQVLELLSAGPAWRELTPEEINDLLERYVGARELIYQALRWLIQQYEQGKSKNTKATSATPSARSAGQQEKETGDVRQLRLPPGVQIAGS